MIMKRGKRIEEGHKYDYRSVLICSIETNAKNQSGNSTLYAKLQVTSNVNYTVLRMSCCWPAVTFSSSTTTLFLRKTTWKILPVIYHPNQPDSASVHRGPFHHWHVHVQSNRNPSVCAAEVWQSTNVSRFLFTNYFVMVQQIFESGRRVNVTGILVVHREHGSETMRYTHVYSW